MNVNDRYLENTQNIRQKGMDHIFDNDVSDDGIVPRPKMIEFELDPEIGIPFELQKDYEKRRKIFMESLDNIYDLWSEGENRCNIEYLLEK